MKNQKTNRLAKGIAFGLMVGSLVFMIDSRNVHAEEGAVLGNNPTVTVNKSITVNATNTSQSSPTNALVAPAPIAQEKPVSSSEIIRRERLMQELKNEDLLQTRIEQLRLEQEMERTKHIVNSTNPMGVSEASVPAPQGHQAVPVVEASSNTVKSESASDEQESGMSVSLRPKGGMAFMMDDGPFKVNSKGSVGVELGLDFTSHVSLDLGYSYNMYGVNAPVSGAYGYGAGSAYGFNNYYNYLNQNIYGNNGQNGNNRSTLNMNQNVFELSMRVAITSKGSKVRPYITGGMAYSRSFINYDEQLKDYLRQYNPNGGDDYKLTAVSGVIGAGVDLTLSKTISFGVQGKYYLPISTNEDGAIYPEAYYSNYGSSYGYGRFNGYRNSYFANNLANADKQRVASQLGYSSFYTVQALMSVNF